MAALDPDFNFEGLVVTAVLSLEPGLAFILLATCALFLVTLVFKKRKAKRYEKNFEILEDVFLKKGTIRHFS